MSPKALENKSVEGEALLGEGSGQQEDPAVLMSQGHGWGAAGPGICWLLSFLLPGTPSSPPTEDPAT